MKDRIETSVDITASRERVWELVAEPGWWINTGTLGGHRIERSGAECTVTDATLGAFTVGVVALEPMTRAVFTWQPGGDDVPRTTVEFTLTDVDPDTVRVSVVERGFGQMDPDQHRRNYGDNVSGWTEELGLLRQRSEHESDAPRP